MLADLLHGLTGGDPEEAEAADEEPMFWRVQHHADPLSSSHRSQIGGDEDELGSEKGTSAMRSLDELKRYARGGHLNWLGDLAVVGFHGEELGRGQDGEPIVRPEREALRIPFSSTSERPTSEAIQSLMPSEEHRKHAREVER
jgi:hypothetical protein